MERISNQYKMPSDSELVLWVLGAAQLIGEWNVEDEITTTEGLIAEQVRVS